MPKQPGGIAKIERIDALRGVLKRWGRLGKPQIDEHVATLLHCRPEEIARSLYRDLSELTEKNEVRVIYYSRDGAEISDYDPEIHKNLYCEWASAEAEAQIVGGAFLKELGAGLQVSAGLKNALSVADCRAEPIGDAVNCYFYFNRSGFSVRVRHQDLPISLVIARQTAAVEIGKPDLAGRRSAVLRLPVSSLSSCKGPGQPGHFKLHAVGPGAICLTDLNSKNGTSWLKLKPEQANELWLKERCAQDATASVGQTGMPLENLGVFPAAEGGKPVDIPLPCLVVISRFFRVLIV